MLENLKKYKIVLASNSPRRRNLLSGLDIDFEVRVISDIDESYPDSIDSMEIPLYIARSKAEAYKPTMAESLRIERKLMLCFMLCRIMYIR